jgi:hypothetical protein
MATSERPLQLPADREPESCGRASRLEEVAARPRCVVSPRHEGLNSFLGQQNGGEGEVLTFEDLNNDTTISFVRARIATMQGIDDPSRVALSFGGAWLGRAMRLWARTASPMRPHSYARDDRGPPELTPQAAPC